MLFRSLETAGFETEWGAATLRLLDELDRWAAGKSDFASARLFLSNVAESPTGGPMALLRVPVTNDLASAWAEVSAREPSALSASWRLMMEDLQHRVLTDARRLSLWMLVAVVAVSWWARRSWRPVALNGLALVLTFGGLLAILWLTREVMTLQSLLTLPVLLAVAVEYSLYMQLGLHAHAGDTRLAFRHLTVPVLLMGLTTIIGFGAPVATKQPMLKNFGMVMAWGTFAAMMTGLVVIPACELFRRNHPHHSETLYRARWFEWGAWLAPRLGWSGARRLGRWLGELYRLTHPQTADAVRSNLAAVKPAPVDEALVRQAFRNYGATLADYFLLGTRPRTEVLDMVEPPVGLEHFQEICGPGQAAVIVTAHLGLFELGSLFTADLKPPPLVLSLPEPSVALGRWRAAYRQRWGAETLEVGDDQFSFVKITRELAKGRSVALLADRPSDTNRVWVDFPHGAMPFSTGPVWLSLLSGCPILAVTTVRLPSGRYRMEAHPPLAPKWLNGSREETVEHYTRQLAAIFRKAICEYPDQWYQFVPLSRSR